jgi:hypothetical protein
MATKKRRVWQPIVEPLEDRLCLTLTTWEWICPVSSGDWATSGY